MRTAAQPMFSEDNFSQRNEICHKGSVQDYISIRPAPDIVRLHELKRTKLHLKDEIEILTRLMNGQVEAA